MSAPSVEIPFWYELPPRMGTDEEFAKARELFAQWNFTERNVSERLGIEHLRDFRSSRTPGFDAPVNDALDAIVRLFVHGMWLDAPTVERWLTAEGIAVLESLQLLGRDLDRPDCWMALSAVIPVMGILTVCDRRCTSDAKPTRLPGDAVYPAIFGNTEEFVKRLPKSGCGDMLEIGTGTGIAALVAASAAKHVCGTDITARSVHYAEFARRLAGATNVEMLEGDMYAPVEGRTFDTIASQPPYMPGKVRLVFREGGEDGEQILRRVIEGLPRYLRPGGRAYSMQMASDRVGETFEQRIRKWLGEHEAEFDVLLALDARVTTEATITSARSGQTASSEETENWRELWRTNHTEALVHGSALVRRHNEQRPAVTVRAFVGEGFEGRHMDWLLEWECSGQRPDALAMLMGLRPEVSPDCEMHAVYKRRDGQFAADQFEFHSMGPFKNAGKFPPWLTQTVTELTGQETWGEVYQRLRDSQRIPPDADPQAFARILGSLVSTGILRVNQAK